MFIRHHGLRLSQRPIVAAVVIALLASSAAAFPPARPHAVRATDGPMAHWTFDDGTGGTATDSAGDFDGTLEGDAAWVTTDAAVGAGAIAFDGVGDGVLVPNAPGLEPSSLTIAVWMRSTYTVPRPGKAHNLVQKGASEGCEAGSWGIDAYQWGDGSGGTLRQQVDLPAQYEWISHGTGGARLYDGVWHHVAFTYTLGQAFLYVDGRQFPGYATPFVYPEPDGDLHIGRFPRTCPYETDYPGELDDLRIYDRALSPAELAAFVSPVGTTTTLNLDTTSVTWGTTFTGTATISPAPSTEDPVRLYRVTGGTHELLATSLADPQTGTARFRITPADPYPPAGAQQLVAEYGGVPGYGPSTSAATTINVLPFPTTTTLTVDKTDLLPDTSFVMTAKAVPVTHGTVTFTATPAGGLPITLGSRALVDLPGGEVASLTVPGLPLGSYTLRASLGATSISAGSTSNTVAAVVHKRATETTWYTTGLLQTNHAIVVNVTVYGQTSPLWPVTKIPTGNVNLRDGTTSLGSRALVNGAASWTFPSLSVGTHSLTFTYGGDSYHLGTTSPARALVIAPDVVQATGVGIDQTTFYPVVDSYRDTLSVRGTRQEPITVAIRIYNSGGTLVRYATLARASGAYTYAWNGRTSTGALLAARQYRVEQTLTDAAGTRKVFTNLVALSHKKLVNKTVYVTKKGNQITAKGTQGTATVTVSTAGYAKVVAGNGWAGVGYEFVMPSATIYRSITFQTQTKGPRSAPPTVIGVQNFTTCPYATAPQWEQSCFDRWVAVGSTSATPVWYSAPASVTANRYGRTVRGMLSVEFGTTYIYYARVKVVYAILQ